MANKNDDFDKLMRDYASQIKRDESHVQPLNDSEVERMFAACKKAALESGEEQARPQLRISWLTWLRMTWRPFAIGGAALAAILTFLVVQGHLGAGDAYVGQTDPSEVRGITFNPLPLKLSVDFKTSKIVLRDSGMKLDGTLTPLATESSSGTNVYQIDMGGKDSAGRIVTLTNGRALFILKTPGGIIKGKEDTTRARLEGRLDVAGQGNYEVKRIYLP